MEVRVFSAAPDSLFFPRYIPWRHKSRCCGALSAIKSYDAYGIPDATNATLGRFGYTGQIWVPELGVYHYKARAYSPTLGRFLQTDPIGYEDQVNLYAYVGNDPGNATDPSGRQSSGRDDNRRVVYVYPRKTHEHVMKNHSPTAPESPGRTRYNDRMTYEEGRAIAGRTLQAADEAGETRDGSAGSTNHIAQVTGIFSSLGSEGEDHNLVATRPLSDLHDPNMINSVAEAMQDPAMVAAIAAAQAEEGGTGEIEIEVIVSQFPVEDPNRHQAWHWPF